MLKKLTEKLQSMAQHSTVDPARFGDPVALQTEWTPVVIGGPAGDKLVEVGSGRLEYRASYKVWLASLFFLLLGLAVMTGFTYAKLKSGGLSLDKNTIMPLVIGLVFALAGVFLLYHGTTPVVFDRKKGFFWKGRTAPDEAVAGKSIRHWARLKEIHALQLLAEFCQGSKSRGYYRYQVNLVLEDGRRLNVTTHVRKDRARADAQALSRFLGRHVWEAF